MLNLFKSSGSLIQDEIYKWAKAYRLTPSLVASVAWHESCGGCVYAERFEPHWYKRLSHLTRKDLEAFGFVPLSPPSLEQEKRGRSSSYGLMQILGQTAREQGFKGRFMAELFDIPTNIYFGCKILAAKRKQIEKTRKPESDEESTRLMLLAYNGGGNPDYPNYIYKILNNNSYLPLYKK